MSALDTASLAFCWGFIAGMLIVDLIEHCIAGWKRSVR
jgi:hypothetical protein